MNRNDRRMNRSDRPPGIVRWTLRLEQASLLDRPVRAVAPVVAAVSEPSHRGRRSAASGSVTRSTRSSPTSRSAPGSLRACSTCPGSRTRSPPSGWSARGCSPPYPPSGPAGPSGRASAPGTGGWGSSTPSPTVSRSVSTQPPGSPAAGVGTGSAPGSRWPVRRWPDPAPIWAATSPRAAGWPATIPRTTRDRPAGRRALPGQVTPAARELRPRPDRGDPPLHQHQHPVGLRQRRALGGGTDDGRAPLAQDRPQLDLGRRVQR